jgi:hypothetical protein
MHNNNITRYANNKKHAFLDGIIAGDAEEEDEEEVNNSNLDVDEHENESKIESDFDEADDDDECDVDEFGISINNNYLQRISVNIGNSIIKFDADCPHFQCLENLLTAQLQSVHAHVLHNKRVGNHNSSNMFVLDLPIYYQHFEAQKYRAQNVIKLITNAVNRTRSETQSQTDSNSSSQMSMSMTTTTVEKDKEFVIGLWLYHTKKRSFAMTNNANNNMKKEDMIKQINVDFLRTQQFQKLISMLEAFYEQIYIELNYRYTMSDFDLDIRQMKSDIKQMQIRNQQNLNISVIECIKRRPTTCLLKSSSSSSSTSKINGGSGDNNNSNHNSNSSAAVGNNSDTATEKNTDVTQAKKSGDMYLQLSVVTKGKNLNDFHTKWKHSNCYGCNYHHWRRAWFEQ